MILCSLFFVMLVYCYAFVLWMHVVFVCCGWLLSLCVLRASNGCVLWLFVMLVCYACMFWLCAIALCLTCVLLLCVVCEAYDEHCDPFYNRFILRSKFACFLITKRPSCPQQKQIYLWWLGAARNKHIHRHNQARIMSVSVRLCLYASVCVCLNHSRVLYNCISQARIIHSPI